MVRQIVLLLPGQGSQYPGMATGIHARDPVFAEVIDAYFAHLGDQGARLRDDWLSGDPDVPLDDGSLAQPLLFGIGYAIGRTLQRRGTMPTILLGHSVGELAAAALAGVYDLSAAARILRGRSTALVGAPAGGMLAVAATPERTASIIETEWARRGLVIGAVNAPAQTILAGADPELALAEQAARRAGLTARRVGSRQPFHSPVLAEATELFTKSIAAETLNAPHTPVMSARTGRLVSPEEAVEPRFWAGLMSEPVLFWQALSALPAEGEFTFVETGPGTGLSTAARRHPSVRAGLSEVVCLSPGPRRDQWAAWQDGLELLDRTNP